MVKRFLYLIPVSLFFIFATVSAAPNISVRYTDLNYRYTVDYIGSINDFSDQPVIKNGTGTNSTARILIELSIESIYGGFDWLPMNPLIRDNNNRIFRDFKVVGEPPAGEKNITLKYIITPTYRDSKWLTFFEEGISEDGKKMYRVFLRNLPVVSN